MYNLTTKTIQGPSLPFKRINHIHGGHRLPPGMLSVSHSITNHILKEDLQNTSGFFINQSTDTLHTSSTSQSANCRLRNALNVVSQNLPVTLRSSLSQTLTSFSTTWHFCGWIERLQRKFEERNCLKKFETDDKRKWFGGLYLYKCKFDDCVMKLFARGVFSSVGCCVDRTVENVDPRETPRIVLLKCVSVSPRANVKFFCSRRVAGRQKKKKSPIVFLIDQSIIHFLFIYNFSKIIFLNKILIKM